MGRGISEVALADLPGVIGKYSNVIYFNDPSDSDLLKTVIGSPRTILINLGQFLNIADGEVQGDALDISELEDSELTHLKEAGRIAQGLIDFNAEGTEDCIITIGAVTYTEEHTATDVTVGEWDNGGSNTASATNLAAAINGDQRNDGGPYYAAVADGTSVWVFALVVGGAGDASISANLTEPDVTDNLIGGAGATVKKTVHIQHTVTAEEATQVEVLIPLPFDAAYFSWQVYDSTGGLDDPVITDRGTVTGAVGTVPAYFKLLTNSTIHIAAGDIIRLTVTN